MALKRFTLSYLLNGQDLGLTIVRIIQWKSKGSTSSPGRVSTPPTCCFYTLGLHVHVGVHHIPNDRQCQTFDTTVNLLVNLGTANKEVINIHYTMHYMNTLSKPPIQLSFTFKRKRPAVTWEYFSPVFDYVENNYQAKIVILVIDGPCTQHKLRRNLFSSEQSFMIGVSRLELGIYFKESMAKGPQMGLGRPDTS